MCMHQLTAECAFVSAVFAMQHHQLLCSLCNIAVSQLDLRVDATTSQRRNLQHQSINEAMAALLCQQVTSAVLLTKVKVLHCQRCNRAIRLIWPLAFLNFECRQSQTRQIGAS